MTSTWLEHVRGTLVGLAVADALGAPFEFGSADRVAQRIDRVGLEMTGGGPWEPGEWTDDTALMLCLAECLAARGLPLDADDLARRYSTWANGGPKDIGITTSAALSGAADASDARARARRYHERSGRSAGNGTVMRAAPIAFATESADERRALAREDALLTHYDPAAGAASAALCAALAAVATGGDPYEATCAEVADDDRFARPMAAVAERDDDELRQRARDQMGAAWTTLAAGLYALVHFDDYASGVEWAVRLGGDTDTNAAVAGALLGCAHGVDAIPDRWLAALRERSRIERVAASLTALSG